MTLQEPSNFYALFAAAADRFADCVAVEVLRPAGHQETRYGELGAMAERIAGWLVARGVARGARVAILADNDANWCAAYLGVMRAAAVAVPLDTSYGPPQIARLLQDSGASAVFVGAKYTAALAEALAPGCACMKVVELPDAGTPRASDVRPEGCADTGPFEPVTAHDPIEGPCMATPQDPAVMLYTSGTTADPKGVVLTHANLLAERDRAFRIVRVTHADVVLSVLPLFHALAQMANLLLPFSAGARVVFLESVNTGELTRALRERDVTAFVCVPQFFYLLHRRIDQEIAALPAPARMFVRVLAKTNLACRRHLRLNPGPLLFRRVHRSVGPALRILVTGGARFDPKVNEALHALGFTIQQAYGLTECAGAATITRPGDLRLESVGRPLPGIEVRIDREASDAADRADGEVLIRGPIVMQGYYNRPEQNAETLRDGWLHTGDLGYLDRAGRLFITGRSKEVIVLGSGKNIYPEEIEAHYEQSAFIQELCVVGLARPGEPAAERLHALVRPDIEALRGRGIVNMRELLRFEVEGLSVQLPAHKRILGYDITLDPLPRTTTRKLKRFEIERRLRDREVGARRNGRRTQPADEAPSDAISARILDEIRSTIRPGAPVTMPSHLELDLGLDSMERVELLVHLTVTFGVDLPDTEAQTLHTVRDLVTALRARVSVLPAERAEAAPWDRLLQARVQDDPFVAELARPKVIRTALLFAVVKMLYAFCRVTVGLRASGQEHLPAEGPYLISPNHQSYVDPFLMVAVLPFRAFRRLFFVGAAEYFETPLMRWLARTINVVPIDPDANLVAAMQAGAAGLRLGKVLVLFPEGERSIDGSVRAFRKGAAILSFHLNAPIVPVAIDGAWTIWARRRPFNWGALLPWSRTRARVAFGPPLVPPSAPEYAAHTQRLKASVISMWTALNAARTTGS